MNYMSEVAKMLGVEIGEEFECSNGFSYKFTELGIINVNDNYKREEVYDRVLLQILIGNYTIKRKPWKPKLDEEYYYVDETGYACSDPWVDSAFDFVFYKIGNCYKTKEDAEKDKNKWIEFYKSDEVLEV